MRVLFTTVAATSHIHSLIPLAQAAAEAGHQAAFACAEESRSTIERLGFPFFPAGTTMGEAWAELLPPPPDMPERERQLWFGGHTFGRVLPARMVPDLLDICRDWAPDLIVREMLEFGGCLAAEARGLPHASVELGTFMSAPWLVGFGGQHVVRLRADLGLPPDPELAMAYRHLHLSFVPPSYQDPAQPLPPTAHALRTIVFDRSGDERLPEWVDRLPERPTVYATLGTMFNDEPDRFRPIITGLRDLPLNLIVTVGRDGDPAAFGPQPDNVRIERYIPQSLLLGRCDAIVCHAGWGTVLAALAHGRPLVLLPMGADQPWNAERCARLGVGRALGPDERTPEAIRAATQDVLNDPSFRTNAARLQAEMASLPGPEHGVELLEALVHRHRTPLAATA